MAAPRPKMGLYPPLQELYDEALQEGKWFFRNGLPDRIILSPKELLHYNNGGHYRWGPDNWRLIDPKEEEARLHNKVLAAREELEIFRKRMKGRQ